MKRIPASIQTAFFTVLFIFLSVYLFANFFGPIPFSVNSVQTTKTDMFTVNGEGEASAVPDTAMVSLGVTSTASSVESAKDKINQTSNEIIAGLKELGIEEKFIKTTNYSVNPNYDFNSGRNTITGYTVSQNLEVEVKPIDKANQVIDMASKSGANQIGNVQFVLDDEERSELEQQARTEAITKAKAKAQQIASAAGIKLGRLINVQESTTGMPQPYYMKADMAAGAPEERLQTDLQPGENTISISVTLFYETL